MVVRALVVCPETYEGSSLRPMPGSLASGLRFASWLVNHVDEPCSVTFLTNADHLSGPQPAPPPELLSDSRPGRPPAAESLEESVSARLRAASAGAGRAGVRTDLASADLVPILEFFGPAGSHPAGGLGEDDAFVLYWIGHGGISRENPAGHLLYLPHNQRVALEDLQRGMAGPGRPGRQLFVIDACREADTTRTADGGARTLTVAAGTVPHPDWLGLVLYGARHGEQALFDEGRGGVFTGRLLDVLEALPTGGALDLKQIRQTAVDLAARFREGYGQGDPEYGQIPTHYWISHQGDRLVDRNFLPGVALTVTQAETLCRTLSGAGLTPKEEGAVWEWLHRYGPRLAVDENLTLPQMAVRVTELPHRADGTHCITDLCVVLARLERLRDGIHQWYASWATDKDLPPLAEVSVPPTPERRRGHLVIDLERLDELSHGEASAERAEPRSIRGPLYRAKAWFYTGHKHQRISLPRQSWRKDEFSHLVKLIYGRAHAKVQSALDGAWVEFIVDRDLFGHRFDTLPRFSVPSGRAPSLGDGGPVVLRDGWRHHGGPQALSWQGRASLLDSVPAARLQWTVCAPSCPTGEAESERHAGPEGSALPLNAVNGAGSASTAAGADGGADCGADPCAGIVLSRPLADQAHVDLVGTALNNGALLAIWPARPPADGCKRGGDDGAVCDGVLVRESLLRRLDGRPLHDLPEIVFDLRRTGGAEAEVFRDMVVLFDDPRRSPRLRRPLNPP
ncbi:caspase family protein [Streptomyces sp. NPDC058625]|uniref:caspase family protein n=1 Tax=Streptomyces sp. NPDC058625 TaxID=3346564 RepID=UPI00366977C5